jgi:hypothetical protein
MNDFGKFLVIAGLLIAAVGILLWSGVGKGWLGKLPGDINYTKGITAEYAKYAKSASFVHSVNSAVLLIPLAKGRMRSKFAGWNSRTN